MATQLSSSACCIVPCCQLMAQLCSFAVLCIRHAAPDQAAYNHEVLWAGSGAGHLPHCLPRGELPPTGPHHAHEHVLQVCCHHFPRSNRSWDYAAITAVVTPNVADLLHWMSTLVHCSCLVLQTCLSAHWLWPPASACTASLGQAGARVCLRPSLLYMLAGLSVSDTTVSTAALRHAISHPNMILLFMQGKQASAGL